MCSISILLVNTPNPEYNTRIIFSYYRRLCLKRNLFLLLLRLGCFGYSLHTAVLKTEVVSIVLILKWIIYNWRQELEELCDKNCFMAKVDEQYLWSFQVATNIPERYSICLLSKTSHDFKLRTCNKIFIGDQ